MVGQKESWVYILASLSKVLYVGVTNDLSRRTHEHKIKAAKGFSAKYQVDRLVYYEQFANIEDAIAREKQLKNWTRQWKIELIESVNPYWEDLSYQL